MLEAFFPLKNIRDIQQTILNEMEKAYASKKRYIILEADTGIGKSAIAKTMSKYEETSYCLTATTALQDQYEKDFKRCGARIIKGQNNYPCVEDTKSDCLHGPCKYSDNKSYASCREKQCPYILARRRAEAAEMYVTSYAYFMRASMPHVNTLGNIEKRNLMIVDECHLLEDSLIDSCAFTIDRVKLNTVFKLTSSINGLGGAARYMKRWNNEDDVYRWCKFVYHVIETHLDRMYEQIGRAKYGNRSRMTADELSAVASIDTSKLISLYDDLKSLYEKIDNFVNTTDTSNWLIHIKSAQEVTITPMSCADLFKKMIDKYAAKHVLFMSATILNVKSFCRDMGIDYDDVYHIKAKSPFDPNKSPIYMDLIAPMTQSRFNASFPAVLKEVEEIMDKYPNQKGIIHTGSYKIMSEIINHISEKNGSRLIYRTGFEKNEVLIEMHSQRKDGSVLISPSMMSGVDLKDDLCRFQIIVKLPYASLSDMRVRKKMNQDHEWYTCKMLRSLVQTCGRGTRSQDDWCDNYILDATMEREMTVQNRNILPEYFVERMRNM